MNIKVTNRDFLKQKVSDLLVTFKNDNNITFQHLAKMLGTNYLQVNRWIKKQTLPVPNKLHEICDTLGVEFTEFLGGNSCLLDRVDIDAIVDHYKFKSQDPSEQKRLLGLAASLVYDYLCSRDLFPTMMLQIGTDAMWSLSEPNSHDFHALYTTTDDLDNLKLFGSVEEIKIQTLSSPPSESFALTKDSLVNIINRQLINKTILDNE